MSSPLLLSKLLLLNLENYSNFGLNEGERGGGKVLKPLLILRFFFMGIMTIEQCTRIKNSIQEEKSAKNCSKCI